MTFAVSRKAYDAFMGRYADRLAPRLIAFADVQPGNRVLDVGCGPGSLTEALGGQVGADDVAAIDPSEPFAAAAAERVPGADVRVGTAESLPWADDTFDAGLSQLVVNFMADADAGIAELRRVVRPGGTVAACGVGPAGAYAASLDPDRLAALREKCRRRLENPDGAFLR
jgi:ubiquinone/menaquinone biosynthesis C-methylase UbiE